MKILSCANSTNCFCCWTLLLIYDLYYSAYLQISILSTFVISARADVSGPPRENSECTLIILLLIWGFRLVGTWGSGGNMGMGRVRMGRRLGRYERSLGRYAAQWGWCPLFLLSNLLALDVWGQPSPKWWWTGLAATHLLIPYSRFEAKQSIAGLVI